MWPAAATASTTTSVSTVLMRILVYPWQTASCTCRIMLVPASSWVHGARSDTSLGWIHLISFFNVLMICLSDSPDVIVVARYNNSSLLLALMRRNCCQFGGTTFKGSTRLRVPFPRLLRASVFRLSEKYSSHTTSSPARILQVGHNVWLEHLVGIVFKGIAAPGFSMLTIAGPSRMITSGVGLQLSVDSTLSSRQFTKSDSVPLRSLPMLDSGGGYAWFSYAKNSSKSPSHICKAMYNLEKRKQSLLRDDNCYWDFDFSRTGGRLNKGRLFLLMGSVMGFVLLTSRSLTYISYWPCPSFTFLPKVSTTAVRGLCCQGQEGRCWFPWMGCPDLWQKQWDPWHPLRRTSEHACSLHGGGCQSLSSQLMLRILQSHVPSRALTPSTGAGLMGSLSGLHHHHHLSHKHCSARGPDWWQ